MGYYHLNNLVLNLSNFIYVKGAMPTPTSEFNIFSVNKNKKLWEEVVFGEVAENVSISRIKEKKRKSLVLSDVVFEPYSRVKVNERAKGSDIDAFPYAYDGNARVDMLSMKKQFHSKSDVYENVMFPLLSVNWLFSFFHVVISDWQEYIRTLFFSVPLSYFETLNRSRVFDDYFLTFGDMSDNNNVVNYKNVASGQYAKFLAALVLESRSASFYNIHNNGEWIAKYVAS